MHLTTRWPLTTYAVNDYQPGQLPYLARSDFNYVITAEQQLQSQEVLDPLSWFPTISPTSLCGSWYARSFRPGPWRERSSDSFPRGLTSCCPFRTRPKTLSADKYAALNLVDGSPAVQAKYI